MLDLQAPQGDTAGHGLGPARMILDAYPNVTSDDLLACLAFAAEVSGDPGAAGRRGQPPRSRPR